MKYSHTSRQKQSLDDLPSDRCRSACNLLRLLRRAREAKITRDAGHGFAIAAQDLADCGFLRIARAIASNSERVIWMEVRR